MLGHLGERQVEVEVQDHHRALVDGQSAELALEAVAIDQPRGEVEGSRRLRVGHHVQLDQVPASSLRANR